MEIILASGSNGRKMLFDSAGIKYRIVKSGFDEDEIMALGLPPDILVEKLAYNKALAVANNYADDAFIIAADTIVHLDGQIYGKPEGKDGAFAMLKTLSGREQTVYTGVSAVKKTGGEKIFRTFHDISYVKFTEMTDNDIRSYVNTGEPEGKSGSYTLLGAGAFFVEKVNGCHTNVIGLPMSRLYRCAKELGVDLLDTV